MACGVGLWPAPSARRRAAKNWSRLPGGIVKFGGGAAVTITFGAAGAIGRTSGAAFRKSGIRRTNAEATAHGDIPGKCSLPGILGASKAIRAKVAMAIAVLRGSMAIQNFE